MRYLFFLLIGIICVIPSSFAASSFSISGTQYYSENPPASTGIEVLYAFNGLSGVQLTYTSNNSGLSFTKYGLDGTQISVPIGDITSYQSGSETVYKISNLEDSYGYVAEGKIAWIVDYTKHGSNLESVTPETPSDEKDRCTNKVVMLNINYNEIPIYYVSIGKNRYTLNRNYCVTYKTLKFDENTFKFENIESEKCHRISRETQVEGTPLITTTFTITDPIASALGMAKASITSGEYTPSIVDAHLNFTTLSEGLEIGTDTLNSNSAPKELHFTVVANEPIAHYYEWYIYKNDPNRVNYLVKRLNEKELTYTFTEAGKYEVVVLVSSEGDTPCTVELSKELEISESSLEIPNFFSPGTSPGYNDVFKVKYKSLVKFKATIFNRWGNKIYEWTDPEQGWDGKYNGKYVNPGVYFYVIEATGSEGKKYKKGGDINIVRGK